MPKKLHEIIAVKASIRSQSVKTMNDLAATFEKKQHHFTAKIKSFIPTGEDATVKVEEELKLQTTVAKELKWLSPYLTNAIDISFQAAIGDTKAKSDIVLEDGTKIASDVPSVTLLELEDRLEEIRKFVDKIPTLDPAKGFTLDPDLGEGVYGARTIETTRTQKKNVPLVLYPATDKHPAQTQLVSEDVPVGRIIQKEWSSMMTPSEKGDMLDRVEVLIRAVKKARSRANETEVGETASIGGSIVKFIFG